MLKILVVSALCVGLSLGSAVACEDPEFIVAQRLSEAHQRSASVLQYLRNEYRVSYNNVQKNPDNEELQANLFDLNVRIEQYVSEFIEENVIFHRHADECIRRYTEAGNDQCLDAIESLMGITSSY